MGRWGRSAFCGVSSMRPGELRASLGLSHLLREAKTIMAPKSVKPKRPRGNPNFVKGHKLGGRKPNSEKPVTGGLRIRLARCAKFMEDFGWAELERIALNRAAPKYQQPALNTLAAYGHGKPAESVDVTSNGKEIKSIGEFLVSGESAATGSTTGD